MAEEGKLLIRMQSRTKAKAEVHATRERSHLIERVYGLEVEVIAERQGPPPATANLAPLAMAGRRPNRETGCRVETRTTA